MKETSNNSAKNATKKVKDKSAKKGWDTSSKIIFAVVTIVVAAIIVFFVARGKKDVIVDRYGQTHIVVTDFWGNFVQDEYGNLYEKVTDDAGNKVTKGYIFPDKLYNKNGNKVENAFIKLKIGKDWTDFSTNNYIAVQHNGDCSSKGTLCEVKISYNIMSDSNTLYAKEKGIVRAYVERIPDYASDLKEYETEIFGLKARAISYAVKSDTSEGVKYYFLVEKGLAAFEIRVHTENSCFTEAEIIKEIEKMYTLKDLGGTRPEVPVTEDPTEEIIDESVTGETTTLAADEKTSTSATSAK